MNGLLLIKGDVTGIQQYIFSVKSKNAARQLKTRSCTIQSLTESVCKEIVDEIGGIPLIIAGGHFIISAPKTQEWGEHKWHSIRQKYEKKERVNNINLVLSKTEIPGATYLEQCFTSCISQLELNAGKDKLRQGQELEDFFEPYSIKQLSDSILNTPPKDIPVWEDCKETIDGIQIPQKGIIDFDSIAAFAKKRTGSELLAALKLDVDNLGECFRHLNTKAESEKLSKRLSYFFESTVKEIRDTKSFMSTNSSHRFRDNVYLVFAGGDDTFAIGAYDAILEFARNIHNEFEIFSKSLRLDIPQLVRDLTFSASIVFFKPTYPTVKIAAQAEEDLMLAKNFSSSKDRISVMGEVFTWNEYDKLLDITSNLVDIIQNRGEPKALIQRIRASRNGFATAIRNTSNGKIEIPRVWRLFYFIRNVKATNKTIIENMIKIYEDLILDAFLKKSTANPMIFPVAARIAEYKLKYFRS